MLKKWSKRWTKKTEMTYSFFWISVKIDYLFFIVYLYLIIFLLPCLPYLSLLFDAMRTKTLEPRNRVIDLVWQMHSMVLITVFWQRSKIHRGWRIRFLVKWNISQCCYILLFEPFQDILSDTFFKSERRVTQRNSTTKHFVLSMFIYQWRNAEITVIMKYHS